MDKYFCPYCKSNFQFKSKSNTGKLICILCGEEMLKKSLINIKQIVSLIIVITFILPLLYSFFILIINKKNFKRDTYQNYSTELIKNFNLRRILL